MSDEKTREKHSRRLQQDENAVARQLRIAKVNPTPESYTSVPHKFEKKHVMNCGNPRCIMCANPRRTFGDKTIQEKRFDQPKIWSEE